MDKITKTFLEDSTLYAADLNALVSKINELIDAYASGTVSIPITGLSIVYKPPVVTDNYKLAVTLTPTNTTQPGISWESSDTTVATVDSTGYVTVIKSGSVTITVKSTSNAAISDSVALTTALSGKLTQTVAMSAISDKTIISDVFAVSASASSGLPLSYSSSDITIATVDASGNVTVVGVGSCTISAIQPGNDTYSSASASRTLVVGYGVAMSSVNAELLVYGDSIANGTAATTTEKQWVSIVSSGLSLTSVKRTQGGRTVQEAYTASAGNSLESVLTTLGAYGFPKYTGSAKYVIFALGINDANNTDSTINPPATFIYAYKTQLAKFISSGKYPKSKIIVCNISRPKTASGIIDRVAALNTQIAAMCDQLGIRYVDIYAAFANGGGDSLLSDNLHPGDTGHDLYANTVLNSLGVSILYPPTVSAGSDASIQLPTATAQLSGMVIANSGSSIVSTVWSLVSGPSTPTFSSTSSLTPTISGLVEGAYTFRLTATDSNAKSAYDDVFIIVSAAATSSPLDTYKTAASITDATQITAVTNLYNSLVSAGVYSKIWGLWLPLGTLSSAQKYNFINPNGVNVNWMNDDSAAHTVKGFTSSSYSSRYGKTGLIITADMLSASGGLFALADNRTSDTSNTASVLLGALRTSASAIQLCRNYNGSIRGVLMSTSNIGVAGSSAYGVGPVAVNYRTADAIIQLYNSTTKIKEQAQSTATAYTNELYIGCQNSNDAPSSIANTTIGTCAIGKALSDTEMTALMAAINTFNTALGI